MLKYYSYKRKGECSNDLDSSLQKNPSDPPEDNCSKKNRVEFHLSEPCLNPTPTESPSLGTPTESPSLGMKEVLNFNCEKQDFLEYIADPGKRPRIMSYDPNIRERIRRMYYLNGASQPHNFKFPQREINGKLRRFCGSWFENFKWLEYSISKDAAYCLYCYLFKNECGHQGGGDTFVSDGFQDWKNKDKFRKHEGETNSAHNQALSRCQDLLNEKQHIETVFVKMTDQAKEEYKTRLVASIDCIRWLLKQGLPFRGHDETPDSRNQGNFIELLTFLSDHNEDVKKVVLENAPLNLKLTSHPIQKDIVRACAVQTTKAILKDLDGSLFSILLDESRDISTKEQMAVALRYVDKKGCVVERMLGFRHVSSTTALSLKNELEDLLSAHGLSINMVRGQGYDGASNMQGEFNGLKALILKENENAYYIHCFAHQLQLALVAVAENHINIAAFFVSISNIVNMIGGSCKRQDMLREKQVDKNTQDLENGEIKSGRGLNQEKTLIRPSDTRWGSHYGTLMSITSLFHSVLEVLDEVMEEARCSKQRGLALQLKKDMRCFEFVFNLHLMRTILGITNDLSQALQRKDQDIVNAITLVGVSKNRLQQMRDVEWDILLAEVVTFCERYEISVPNMDDLYETERPKRRGERMKNLNYYHYDLFNTVIDKQLQELNNRFNEVNSELLLCVACLNPCNSFAAFNKERVIRLAEFYPNDFSHIELLAFPHQLENFIRDVSKNVEFSELHGLSDITQKMVQTRKDLAYPLVYKLLSLALLLPVATATVERAFSGMKIVKTRLRNRMSDDFLSNCLMVYIEKEVFDSVSNETIVREFQDMAKRRGRL